MGTTAEKLAYLKESKEQIKNALETPSNVMRDYANWIKKYVDNQPTSKVSNGVCKNALDVPIVRVGIDGNSYQGENPSPDNPQDIEVIDGVNLFDKNDETKIIKGYMDNNKINSYSTNTTIFIPCKKNTSYSIIKNTGVSNIEIACSSSLPTIGTSISNKSIPQKLNSIYTTTNNAEYLIVFIQGTSDLTDGYTVGQILDSIQLTEGTIQKPYLPYGSIGLEQSGKNWFDDNKVYDLTKLAYSNGIYTASDNDTRNSLQYKIQQYNDSTFLGESTQVTKVISNTGRYYFTSTKKNNANNVRIANSGEVAEFTLRYPLDDIKVGEKFTIAMDIIDTTIGASKFKNVMLLRGEYTSEESIPYEPYHSPKLYPINLNGNSLAKVGDIKDLLKVYRNGDVEIEKKIGKVVLTGNENWQSDLSGNKIEDGVYGATSKISDMKDYPRFAYGNLGKTSIACNYFKLSNIYGKAINGIDNGWGPNIYITILTSEIDNPTTISEGLTKFKQWLSTLYNTGTPVYVDYELVKPQTTKLPSIEPIELWEGTNNFKLITNLDTTFEMEYVVNKDSVLNEVQTAMLEAEIEI